MYHRGKSIFTKFYKYIFLLFVLIGLLFVVSSVTFAENPNVKYGWGSIGIDNDSNLGFSVGARMKNNPFGMEIGMSTTFKYPNINNYPCPHGYYYIVDDKSFTFSFGVDGLLFIDPIPNISIYGGIGAYFLTFRQVAQSDATGWLYDEGKTYEVRGAVSTGVQFHYNDNVGYGVGYHSIRGFNANMLIRF